MSLKTREKKHTWQYEMVAISWPQTYMIARITDNAIFEIKTVSAKIHGIKFQLVYSCIG